MSTEEIITEEIPSLEMSQDEKEFVITQAYEGVFREITFTWLATRSVYDVQEHLNKFTSDQNSPPNKWALLYAEDYYNGQHRYFDSVTLRQEWIDFYISSFLQIAKKMATSFQDPYSL